jgi:hypothetical protein
VHLLPITKLNVIAPRVLDALYLQCLDAMYSVNR